MFFGVFMICIFFSYNEGTHTPPPHHLRRRKFPIESGIFLKRRTHDKKNIGRDGVKMEEKTDPGEHF